MSVKITPTEVYVDYTLVATKNPQYNDWDLTPEIEKVLDDAAAASFRQAVEDAVEFVGRLQSQYKYKSLP